MAQKSEPIRLQRSLLEEVQKLAQEEGTSVSEFVNVAVAERVGALRRARFFAERAARADVASAIELLRHLGAANEPLPGDEIAGTLRLTTISRWPAAPGATAGAKLRLLDTLTPR